MTNQIESQRLRYAADAARKAEREADAERPSQSPAQPEEG